MSLDELEDPRAHGEIFNLAGTHTYRDPDLARCIVETVGSASLIEWADPTRIRRQELNMDFWQTNPLQDVTLVRGLGRFNL